ncbi:hypothetical protein FUAX_02410 [Fulvitalea axinellae]|uniref:CAAX prenyl protease 2/Lysostaphin resistance protein A-like domain-containing protein n=1 Tax=Fulvitalea axinellae TaxID=1182444 RepID=A0AAU9CN91_9BACT|nr:hypothetical protein FUAX_02410 [Fulvitalea axinellae]
MNEKTYAKGYLSVGQAWGILGLGMLFTFVIFLPTVVFTANSLGDELASFLGYTVTFGATFWVAHIFYKKEVGHVRYDLSLSSVKVMALAMLVICCLQIGVTIPIASLIPMPEIFKQAFSQMAQNKGLFGFLTVVIVAPVLEEFIFRGVILKGLLKKYSPHKSILLSSFLFGIMHFNPWQFVTAMVIGVFSGWVFYKTKKLSLSILIHVVNNALAFVPLYFMQQDSASQMDLSWMQGIEQGYGSLLNFGLVVAGAVMTSVFGIMILNKEWSKPKAVEGNVVEELAVED